MVFKYLNKIRKPVENQPVIPYISIIKDIPVDIPVKDIPVLHYFPVEPTNLHSDSSLRASPVLSHSRFVSPQSLRF